MTQPPGEDEIAAAEDRAADDVEEAVTTATAAVVTAAILLALLPKLRSVVESAVRGGFVLGAASAPPRAARGRRSVRRRAGRTPKWRGAAAFLGGLAKALKNALAAAVDDVEAGLDAQAVVGRLVRRVRSIAFTAVSAAVAEGTAAAARIAGASLMWMVDVKPCPVCVEMDGVTVGAGQLFPQPAAFKGLGWKGLPPVHPNCRCRVKVLRTVSRTQTDPPRTRASTRAGRRSTTRR